MLTRFKRGMFVITSKRFVNGPGTNTLVGQLVKHFEQKASPRHSTGAFQYGTTEEANEINARIPSSTEILITHTPPYRTLDKTHSGKHAGCRNLAERLTSNDLKNCRLHVFGHIHEAAGAIIMDREHTELVAVNAAMMHRKMAVVVDLKN
ncbi:hypothetical protein D9757_001727 [Collybiopsis confluens]|uniref:Uncharacterized protein n=1 Tax=Collybiopsis confluens TaxID=2823264 RepID=A0A8H5HYP6_9AGAR|nr:hypothetical protein D9757_001727 [Collybiopsis confluens]